MPCSLTFECQFFAFMVFEMMKMLWESHFGESNVPLHKVMKFKAYIN